jgi:hypothetical protein
MIKEQQINQPNLFESNAANAEVEKVLLYALGEFQSRGKALAERELALDRLRGAFKRAAEKFGCEEFSDEELAKNLDRMGAKVKKVPNFVAKHPFRVTVQIKLANAAKEFYQNTLNNV